ncbi:glutamate synthase subunit beta [Rarobacter faecitabidus]|uniref:Glutamate synthase (NADPH/NADH) small chain n=1 Tax=Rarobacter faecitabidus TaxID=13243 RepID=A0A542ZUY4_RARFA|nr:glutamate synthase subunit beta [Rarobacter faecitabidus]TQL64164.1 glutamate synthase (NADPH/NADH) small chain [Rarobacter faecitabidus]
MADPRGFLVSRAREIPADRSVDERVRDWDEVRACLPLTVEDRSVAARQAGRCMDCGVPFCHFSCPLGNLVPDWNDLARQEHWGDASERLHATNNFPEITGRLCPALCESACVLSITDPAVTIRNIELTIAEEAFARGVIQAQPAQAHSAKRVAVVGSGPAGLAAAQQLTRSGHSVAVFEKADAPGGLLRYGIPEFKMSAAVVDRRVEQMRQEGTAFHLGVDVGVDVTPDELRDRFDAVIIAAGSTVPRDMQVPGRDLRGVIQAMDYLVPATRRVHGLPNEELWDARGQRVVVIGGGDTGSDCVGTAVRQGAASITQLEIMPKPPKSRAAHQPWPVHPQVYKVTSSHQEGGERLYRLATSAFESTDGERVSGVVLDEVAFADGRFAPTSADALRLDADLVILAMGFVGVPADEFARWGLPVDERGRIERDEAFTTCQEGVFVAGDAGRGQSLIVWAIAEGRSVAAAVDEYLSGDTQLHRPITAHTQSMTA